MKAPTKIRNTSFNGDVSIKWFEDGTLNASVSCLDRHLAERPGPGDAVAVGVEGHRLVLVGDGPALDAGVERVPGQRSRGGELLGEAVADDEGPGGRPDGPSPLIEASLPHVFVQFVDAGDAWHGGGEPPLDGADGALDVGLLVGLGGEAELGLEGVVAGQCGVAGVEDALPTAKDQGGDGLGVIPPDFAWRGVENLLEKCEPGRGFSFLASWNARLVRNNVLVSGSRSAHACSVLTNSVSPRGWPASSCGTPRVLT